jgi:hypothetical protein
VESKELHIKGRTFLEAPSILIDIINFHQLWCLGYLRDIELSESMLGAESQDWW